MSWASLYLWFVASLECSRQKASKCVHLFCANGKIFVKNSISEIVE
jgi:hypothetical protein